MTLQRGQQLSLSTPKFPWPHLPSQLAFLSAPVQEAVKAPVSADVPQEQGSYREQPVHLPPWWGVAGIISTQDWGSKTE